MIKSNRELISTREAAELLACTQGRIRQLVLGDPPELWSDHLGNNLVVDRKEVLARKDRYEKLRRKGSVPGPSPKGFQPDAKKSA